MIYLYKTIILWVSSMKLMKQPLRLYDIYPVCDECNAALQENNEVLARVYIVYTCPKCGKNYYLDEKYPKRVAEKLGTPVIVNK